MPLRSFRFYLFGYRHYYGHIRLPSIAVATALDRVSHVHALPSDSTQHHLTPGSLYFAFTVIFKYNVGFIIYGRLTTTSCLTKPY